MQAAELRILRRSRDHREAVDAFREKRDPIFSRT
jgi:enoyl-CoA hydratase/carnithine racemase